MKFMDRLDTSLAAGEPLATERHDLLYRTIGFGILCLLPMAFMWGSVRSLLSFILGDETYTHIPLIPIVSFYLIYAERKSIFANTAYAGKIGSAVVVPGAVCLVLARLNIWGLSSTNQNSLLMLGFVLIWVGAFGLFYGNHPIRAAAFPLLFLLFVVPVPQPLLSHVIFLLQEGSSKAAEWFFRLMGVPFLRQGFDFSLPGITIRVAEECSGIRSTLALLILTVLASHLFLRRSRNGVILCLFAVPIAIVKNGFRIASLSTLAVYVNPIFLTGPIHHQGGALFFVFALIMMALLLKFLQSTESGGRAAGLIK